MADLSSPSSPPDGAIRDETLRLIYADQELTAIRENLEDCSASIFFWTNVNISLFTFTIINLIFKSNNINDSILIDIVTIFSILLLIFIVLLSGGQYYDAFKRDYDYRNYFHQYRRYLENRRRAVPSESAMRRHIPSGAVKASVFLTIQLAVASLAMVAMPYVYPQAPDWSGAETGSCKSDFTRPERALYHDGLGHIAEQDFFRAKDAFDALIGRYGQLAAGHFGLARLDVQRGEWRRALGQFNTVIEHSACVPYWGALAHAWRAKMRARFGFRDAAETDLAIFARIAPADAIAAMQTALKTAGYFDPAPDGTDTPAFRLALRRWAVGGNAAAAPPEPPL